jgi:hypothetical protein
VAPGDEDVGAELYRRGVLGAEPVHAVDAEEDAFSLAAAPVALATASAISEGELHSSRTSAPR